MGKKRPVRVTLSFIVGSLKAFKANQGLLLAGAVAYYALLSIVPLLILIVIALSHVIEQERLLAALSLYIGWLVPGQGGIITAELANFMAHREVMGWVLLVTMLFFSSLAFTVLENAMSVIFHHRVSIRRRHFLLSAILPYCYIVILAIGALMVTIVSGALAAMGDRSVELFGQDWDLGGVSGALLYLLGVAGEVLILSSIYLVMPVGRISRRHALIGGATATFLWEITRRLLLWYFETLSRVGEVYGAFTTAIVVMLSIEILATLLLFGAQVIAEYERLERPGVKKKEPEPMRTD